jgi:hypothetical protein
VSLCIALCVSAAGEYAGDSVAVKLLPIGSVFAEDSRKEACLALCLHHPNIVSSVCVFTFALCLGHTTLLHMHRQQQHWRQCIVQVVLGCALLHHATEAAAAGSATFSAPTAAAIVSVPAPAPTASAAAAALLLLLLLLPPGACGGCAPCRGGGATFSGVGAGGCSWW